jgi:hypothetical protein
MWAGRRSSGASNVDRDRQVGRERLQRPGEAAVGADRRVQAAGDLAQLLQAVLELARRLVEQRAWCRRRRGLPGGT